VIPLFCVISFYVISFGILLYINFFVAIYQCRSGSPIEKHLDLALNFHVRMMIDSLALSKRTNCQRIVEPNATVELMSLATLSASQHTYKLQLAEDTLHPQTITDFSTTVRIPGKIGHSGIIVRLYDCDYVVTKLLQSKQQPATKGSDRLARLQCRKSATMQLQLSTLPLSNLQQH